MNTNDDNNLATLLARLHACRAAQEWAAGKTPEQAWNECPRGDWMLWLAGMLDIDRKVLVRATCACARLALPHVPAGETRPLKALETAEAWTRGEATLEDVRAAEEAALEAAWTAWEAVDVEAWTAAAAVAWAAACAVACAAAAAAAAAWGAAWGAAEAAAEAWAAEKRESALAECADLVRRHIPFAEIAEKAKRLW